MDGIKGTSEVKSWREEPIAEIMWEIESSPYPVKYIEIGRGVYQIVPTSHYEVASARDFENSARPDGFLCEVPVFEKRYGVKEWEEYEMKYSEVLEYDIIFNKNIRYCDRCSFNMFYDEKLEEFYCPCYDDEDSWNWRKRYLRKTFIERPYTWLHDRFASQE